jgi:hypothetical protein
MGNASDIPHVLHPACLNPAGNDFAGCRFCFDPFRLDSGNFTAGSMDGEVLTGNLIRPPGDDNPDYTRCIFAPHAGPLVALCVSPFLPDVLLSVGDWTFRLWQGVESKVPVFTSPYSEEAYTAGETARVRRNTYDTALIDIQCQKSCKDAQGNSA